MGLSQASRQFHAMLLGKTGGGKSTVLQNLIIQDILAGRGLCFIDPHGQDAETLLSVVPPWRFDHVTYLDPAGERAFPVAWNPLSYVSLDERHLKAERVVAVFRAIWKLSPERTPRLPEVLYNLVRALLDLPERDGATMLDIPRLITDPQGFRAHVVEHIQDSQCRDFWTKEVKLKSKSDQADMFDPVLTRVGAFLHSPALRNILGQPKQRSNPRFMMDHSRILIVNLRKGLLGEEAANLLGALIVADFEGAAYSRQDIPEEERVPFYLYADEFQNITTDTFALVLPETRKYGLLLTLACQFLAQLDDRLISSVLGNVGNFIVFGIGEEDAPILAPKFAPFSQQALLELAPYEVLCRLKYGPRGGAPFQAKTLEPLTKLLPIAHEKGDTVLGRSRRHFARPRREVERRQR